MIKRKGRIMSESKWPEWVWVDLTAEDFCKGVAVKGDCKYILRWVEDTFLDLERCNRIYDLMDCIAGGYIYKMWVKDPKVALKMQADLWNKTMKELGYTEEYKE